MIRKLSKLAVLALALLVPIAACEDAGGLTGGDESQLSLLLTDAPGDFEAAVVTISQIYLQGDGENGRVVLRDEPVTTNLLTLANDVATLVEDATVSAGTYSQLRFIIGGGYIVVEGENGSNMVYATRGFNVPDALEVDGTLLCPSCAQTGIKVNLPGGGLTVEGERKVVLVDFDVSQTFGQKAGRSGLWVMHPTLRATDVTLSGTVNVAVSVADSVTLPMIGDTLQVELTDFAAVLKDTADEDGPGERVGLSADGTVEFTYVIPGDYVVGLELLELDAVTFTTNPAVPVPVTVESGQTVAVELTITSAAVSQSGS